MTPDSFVVRQILANIPLFCCDSTSWLHPVSLVDFPSLFLKPDSNGTMTLLQSLPYILPHHIFAFLCVSSSGIPHLLLLSCQSSVDAFHTISRRLSVYYLAPSLRCSGAVCFPYLLPDNTHKFLMSAQFLPYSLLCVHAQLMTHDLACAACLAVIKCSFQRGFDRFEPHYCLQFSKFVLRPHSTNARLFHLCISYRSVCPLSS